MRLHSNRVVFLLVSAISCAATLAAGCSPPTSCPAADFLAGKPIPAGGTSHGGTEGSQTWKASDSPHRVPDGTSIGVGAGTSLTIEPCALVVLGVGASIAVGDGQGPGELIVAGDATHPIAFTGSAAGKDAWGGIDFEANGAGTVLSYVTVEHAYQGARPGIQASIVFSGSSSPRIDHTTVRDGKGHGIYADGNSQFGAGSGDNVIKGMGVRPIALHVAALNSLPEGTYTGNGDDRIEVVHGGGRVKGAVTWPKRSLDYLLTGLHIGVDGKLTIEPGVHIFVLDDPPGANFDFANGGSIVADGSSAVTRIVLEGEKGSRWGGFAFRVADPGVGQTASGTGLFNFVTLKNAGGMSMNGNPVCTDNLTLAPNSAIFAEQDVLDVKSTEFFDVGANNFAIGRAFCGNGGEYMTETSRNNVFHAPMHCPVTDHHECLAPNGCNPQIPNGLCCLHAYACHGTVTP